MSENSPESNGPDKQNWLRAQWQRVRDLAKRDVVIAQVGEGSQNVAVGKNIFQLNVGGRNITPYVLVIALAVLVIAGYFLYPLVEPMWNPWQMRGSLNIAVADFGLLQNGQMKSSALGSDLSAAMYEELTTQYEGIRSASPGEAGRTPVSDVLIWHDTMPAEQGEKNVDFGVIKGATPKERSDAAAALARRINANIVIYGYLTPDGSPEGLILEFYYNSPAIADEPDTATGSHQMGATIAADVPLDDPRHESTAKLQMTPALNLRSGVVFWLTQAFSYDFANQPETALKILQEAETRLADWPAADGKEILYFFLGRAALFSREFEEAIRAGEMAIAINPDYVNGYALLGLTYMDRAQLYFVRGRALSAEEAACTSVKNIEAAAETLDEAAADAQQAVAYLEEAARLAPTSFWPPIEPYVQMNLGLAYRVLGLSSIFEQQYEPAGQALSSAAGQLNAAVTAFPAEESPQYFAWSQMGLGLTYRLQAHLASVDDFLATESGKADEAAAARARTIALLGDTVQAYQACIDQKESTLGYPVFQKKVLECSCVPYRDSAEKAQKALEEEGNRE